MIKKIAFLLLFISTHVNSHPPLHICCVASDHTNGLKQLLKTCEHNGLKVDVLGLGLPYRGNPQRFEYIKKYIRNIPDEDLVLVTDAYDVLIFAREEEIVEKFLSFNHPCVFAAETHLYPRTHVGHLEKKFPKSPTRFKYLNGGGYMASAQTLRKILNELKYDRDGYSDQLAWIPYYVDHQDTIMLDFNCVLFLAMHGVYRKHIEFDYENKRIELLLTGTKPAVIHGNGMGKSFYQHIYDQLF